MKRRSLFNIFLAFPLLIQLVSAKEGESETWPCSALDSGQQIIQEILSTDFFTGLLEGTLPQKAFVHYLLQNCCYLRSYAEALELFSLKSDLMPEERKVLSKWIEETLELIPYTKGLAEKTIPGALKSSAALPGSTVSAYSLFEKTYVRTKHAAVAWAALLPCFWVYGQLQNHLEKTKIRPDHPYREWLESFQSTGESASVDKALSIANRLAKLNGGKDQKAMVEAFIKGCRYESALLAESTRIRY